MSARGRKYPSAFSRHERGEGAGPSGGGGGDGEGARGRGPFSVLDRGDARGLAGETRHAEDQLAGLRHRHLVELRPSRGRELIDDGFGLRIERHGSSPLVSSHSPIRHAAATPRPFEAGPTRGVPAMPERRALTLTI